MVQGSFELGLQVRHERAQRLPDSLVGLSTLQPITSELLRRLSFRICNMEDAEEEFAKLTEHGNQTIRLAPRCVVAKHQFHLSPLVLTVWRIHQYALPCI